MNFQTAGDSGKKNTQKITYNTDNISMLMQMQLELNSGAVASK